MAVRFANSMITGEKLSPPAEQLVTRFQQLMALATRSGFRVDGQPLAHALLCEDALARMEQWVFNEVALTSLSEKATRIEFIVEGPLPPELLRESPLKRETIFRQTIGYELCKACRLCIEICPKDVYEDDGFGRPDRWDRRAEECTGPECGQCVSICPEQTIHLDLANPAFRSTIFILLENPFAHAAAAVAAEEDFYVANPLETGKPLTLKGELNPVDLLDCHRVLNESAFYPVFEINGTAQHLVDSRAPEEDLARWARENHRHPQYVLAAVRLLYQHLSKINGLKEGKYAVHILVHRIMDEIIHGEVDVERPGGLALLKHITKEAYLPEHFFGAKRRPIGGLLPTGTSAAWKTPYGERVPVYVRLEKCLGPECGLCVTHCPEGGGGETAAVRMVPRVPLGTIPALVRGMKVYLLNLSDAHAISADLEDLTGRRPFEFAVNTDYCKSCGTCMACCPHGVIDGAVRSFDLRERVE
ncbi:MAG: hypothetical protein HYR55_19725 [Acidobacteria bacterium]|nr:hypothetical protein [Acidobacteriota bacterium]MBI3656093.1 hypothetical protein [Acidobacteriota bacterium]